MQSSPDYPAAVSGPPQTAPDQYPINIGIPASPTTQAIQLRRQQIVQGVRVRDFAKQKTTIVYTSLFLSTAFIPLSLVLKYHLSITRPIPFIIYLLGATNQHSTWCLDKMIPPKRVMEFIKSPQNKQILLINFVVLPLLIVTDSALKQYLDDKGSSILANPGKVLLSVITIIALLEIFFNIFYSYERFLKKPESGLL